MQSIFNIIVEYRVGFAEGLKVTLEIALIIWSIGLILGTVFGVLSSKWKVGFGYPARFFSFVLSGIPVLVLLFWLHYPLQAIMNIVINPFYTASAALTLINIFAVADVIRNVLNDFPEQYIQAAKVCGLTRRQTLFRIQLPIILRQVMPGLLITQVNMLQMTLFASLISVDEVFRVAQRINAQIYKPVEIYSALGFLFLMICLPLNGIALWLKSKFTRNLSER